MAHRTRNQIIGNRSVMVIPRLPKVGSTFTRLGHDYEVKGVGQFRSVDNLYQIRCTSDGRDFNLLAELIK